MANEPIRYTRRTPEDTIYVQYLLHIGFSKSLIANALLKEHEKPFSLWSICHAEKIKGQLAYRKYKWPTRPSAKNPGNLIKSHDNILEFSLFGSSLLYLYDERIYEQLSIDEIINAYDLYTNIRQQDNTLSQITPDTAYWIVRELTSHCAALIFCPHCLFHYYSSLCQPIKMCCPFESQH